MLDNQQLMNWKLVLLKTISFLSTLLVMSCRAAQNLALATSKPQPLPTAMATFTPTAPISKWPTATPVVTELLLTTTATMRPTTPTVAEATKTIRPITPTLSPTLTAPPVITTTLPKPTVTTPPPATSSLPIFAEATGMPAGDYFRILGTLSQPTDPLTLEWQITGADTVNLHVEAGVDIYQRSLHFSETGSGQMVWNFANSEGGWPATFGLSAIEPAISTSIFIEQLPCAKEWFIYDFYGRGCPLESAAFVQRFEHGMMLWLEASDIVYASTWEGDPSSSFPDTFEHGSDPIDDPALEPPEGLYQPQYGIGKDAAHLDGVDAGGGVYTDSDAAVVAVPADLIAHLNLGGGVFFFALAKLLVEELAFESEDAGEGIGKAVTEEMFVA